MNKEEKVKCDYCGYQFKTNQQIAICPICGKIVYKKG
jgi:rubrerythrin